MASPTQAGQFARWVHSTHSPSMMVRSFGNPDRAFEQVATCEWFTQHGMFQRETFLVSDLEATTELPESPR